MNLLKLILNKLIEIMNYAKFYDLESYIFGEVTKFFHEKGYLEGFHFYLILIWKANRAKHRNALKILNNAENKSFDEGVKLLTHQINKAETDLEKIKTLYEWKFRTATASAILTVLYPDKFTVYDYRVLQYKELLAFKNLENKTNMK